MRSYIFVDYYLAGLYFATIDSVRKCLPIKIYFNEIIYKVILLRRFYKIHPNSIRIIPMCCYVNK